MMLQRTIKIVFFGSAEFSESILAALFKEFTVAAIVTETDKPTGRGALTQPALLKSLAQSENIVCFQPESLRHNDELLQQLKNINPDLIVVAAYGKILPDEILAIPQYGCLNVHPSLLPKYRGAAPMQAALLNGETKTGVSLIVMNSKMDAGDIIAQKQMTIQPADTYETLAKRLSSLSAELLIAIIPAWIQGSVMRQPQNEQEATFCQKISKEDGQIDWRKSAMVINNQRRAFAPWPGSYTFFNKKKLDILQAVPISLDASDAYLPGQVRRAADKVLIQCGDGAWQLLQVKLAGGRALAITDFINGQRDFIGSTLPN